MPPVNVPYGVPGCPCCGGAGGWEDPVAQQSIVCPICHPGGYEPAGLRFAPRIARLQYSECRYFGPAMPVLPWLWVLHTGGGDGDIERFFAETGFVRRPDGTIIKVSAHVAYSARLGRRLVQGVPLDRVAWHCGGSRIVKAALVRAVEAAGAQLPVAPGGGAVIGKLNFASWGTELQGPQGRHFTASDMDEVVALGQDLRAVNPGLAVVTTHDRIDAGKRDPGRHFDLDGLAQELGMVAYPGPR